MYGYASVSRGIPRRSKRLPLVAIEEGEQGIGLLFEGIDQVIEDGGGWHGGGRPSRVGMEPHATGDYKTSSSLCQPGMVKKRRGAKTMRKGDALYKRKEERTSGPKGRRFFTGFMYGLKARTLRGKRTSGAKAPYLLPFLLWVQPGCSSMPPASRVNKNRSCRRSVSAYPELYLFRVTAKPHQ